MLYPAPVSAPTSPCDAVPDGTPDRHDEMATSIIDRLPETARLSTLRIKPGECSVCGTNTRMSVLVNSDRMPETGGPIYAEACDYCLGRVCMRLVHAGIEVSGLGTDDHDDDESTPPIVTDIIDQVCEKLADAGIEVSGLGTDDHDDDESTPPIVTDIIDRLPDTACLITDTHPLSGDPENMGEPDQCGICDQVVTPAMMAVLVDLNHMPDSGGPTYAEACDDCIGWLCGKLADAGVGVDVED